ncbi:MAG: hypothetical protein KJ558_16820 [Gammaproteobacteria bacterium]|nr:hypothetical protein [Gammaproteobacteria bacterium]MBU1656456.1 hypothetical protein [Gammaproteobacteria bacterium]MBU1962253.1 hypothetical protein [Gammaproteobacteria bacterium]
MRKAAYVLACYLLSFSSLVDARGLEALAPSAEGEQTLCEVTVFADRAEFLFPLHDADRWRWQRKETPDDTPEYAWEVMIPAEKPTHVFGAYLFKQANSPTKEGDLRSLVADSRKVVSRILSEGETRRHLPDPEVSVDVQVEENGVILTLMGEKGLHKVLAGAPRDALFHIWHPDRIYNFTCKARINHEVVLDAQAEEKL